MKRHDAHTIVKKLQERFTLKSKSKDHLKYNIYDGNRLVTMIKFSHALKDYQDKLIAGNLHISTTELCKYIDCNFTNEDLIETLKSKNLWEN